MGAIGHNGLAIPGKVELAHEPYFRLGLVEVHPATREVIAADRTEILEPRVMQVLVALARAGSRVVTRDELIEWCWDGRIVGEDSINRVISLIRQLGSGAGGGSFSIETITKVGYRLTIAAGAQPTQAEMSSPEPAASRRALLVGGGAAVAAATIGLAAWKPWRHRPPGEAQDLYRRAEIAWKSGFDDQARQAVSYLEQAVRIDPRFSKAWGSLAVTYTHFLEGFGEAEMASLPDRIRGAAARALELDPDNGEARLGLACIKPAYGNWTEQERELRQICADHPDLWLAHGRLGMLMYQTGRQRDGIRLHQKVIGIDPMIPVPYLAISRALANLGRVQEADELLDEAHRRWPAHPLIWNSRYFHLLFGGRPGAAAALAMNPDARPSGVPDELVQLRLKLARTVDSGKPSEIAALVEEQRQGALSEPAYIPVAAAFFGLFGQLDLLFAGLDRYYFNKGGFGSPWPIRSHTRRYTDTLFSRPLREATKDPRFATVLRASGLEAYWRQARVLPDYRRT